MSRRTLILAAAAVCALAGCGGGSDSDKGGGGPGPGSKASSYALAVKEMDDQAYDDALARMRALGDYRDAPERVRQFEVRAARETLVNAKTKSLKKAPRAAMSLAKTSLKYHPTPEARAFLKAATEAHDSFKRKQQAAGNY